MDDTAFRACRPFTGLRAMRRTSDSHTCTVTTCDGLSSYDDKVHIQGIRK